ncbi:GNAT family N-acetyltransferase [Cognatishimia activa]|uniref:GNAT family N-acetyltransferase n=1 Tax=Cognatishimia activa TaxID=1715691 RepID=UPI00223147BD|nr:GNAT family N-acetyltransferase [Cognatishimia activa]UZD89851.1 GNAT family N-acetyltransferase [Cognatishimia activa]
MSFTVAPTLTTERLRLRAFRREDFDDHAALWAHPTVVEHITGEPATPSEAWLRLMRAMGTWSMLGYGYWVVEDRYDQTFLGEVGVADFYRDMEPSIRGIPEAGWVLAPEAHGRGIATEAMQAVLAWVDEHLDVGKTVCILDEGYSASKNVALKLGYKDVTLTRFAGKPTLLMERPRAS